MPEMYGSDVAPSLELSTHNVFSNVEAIDAQSDAAA